MKRIYYCIILFFCSLLLISCRGEVPQEFVLAGPAEPQKLSIVRVTPEGSVLEENQTDTISVSFNQAIVPLTTLPEDETEGPLQFDPAIAGKYRWMGTSTLTFIPDSPLPYGTSYKATVPSGLKALTGALLEKEYTWNFETLRPAYKDRSPSDSALLPLKGPLYILFNQPVSPEKAGDFLKLSCDNKEIPLVSEKTSDKDKLPEHWNKENVLLIKPEEKLEPSKVYTLRLLKGLPGERGDLGLEEEVSLEFKSENIFAFKEIVGGKDHQPEDEAGFKFTNPVSYKELIKNIKFEPSIEINENYDTFSDTDTPYLYLLLLPKTEYKVTLSKDMKDVFGNTLGKDVKTSFNTKDYLPSIFIEGGTGTVEAGSEKLFPVSLMNVDKVKLQMANISRDEVIPLLRWYLVDAESLKEVKKQLSSEISAGRLNKLDSLSGRKICRTNYPVILKDLGFSKEEIKTIEGYYYLFKSALAYGETYNPGDGFYNADRLWETGVKKNKFTWLPVKLDEALGTKNTGFVFLQLDAMNDGIDGTLSKAFVQVTNLGVTGKFSKDNNLICVHTLDTAEPVPGADVELRNDENKILWTGKTGKDGTLETPGWQGLGLSQNDCDVWAFVTSGNDTSVINSSGSWSVRLYSFDIYNYQSPDNELNTCIFTDKGVYRGGEDIHFKGTVREKIEGKWEVPSVIKKVRIELCNSRNEEVVKEDLSLSGYGSFDYTFKLNEEVPSGDWYIALSAEVNKEEYSLGYKSFLVEDYEAAQFEVTVESDKEYYLTGDKFSGKIKGWYLFGAPMKGENITWYSDLAPSYYEPPGYSEFDFNTDFFCEESDTVTTGNGEGKLDESGVFPIDFEIKSEKLKGVPFATGNSMSEESKIRDVVDAVAGVAHAVPVYQDVVQPAAQEIGKALQTVARTVHLALSPVSALVWGYDQIKDFVSTKVADRLKNVPPENILTPKPNVAGPALESLRYTGHESSLGDLYANLLASAMDKTTASGAHPAFVEIIRQLTPDEAKIIALFARNMPYPLLNVRWEYKTPNPKEGKSGGCYVLVNYSHLGQIAECEFPDLTPTYIDNLCRLGLAEVPTLFQYTGFGIYDALEFSSEVQMVKERIEENSEFIAKVERKGLLVTQLGLQFVKICVLQKS